VTKPDDPWSFLAQECESYATSAGASTSRTTATSSSPLGVIISGPPAAGKGTQCELIKKEFGLAHISTGDLLRDEVKKGTSLGLTAKGFMDKGGLVPDDIVIGMVQSRMAQPGTVILHTHHSIPSMDHQ
jgi:adenylate kinase